MTLKYHFKNVREVEQRLARGESMDHEAAADYYWSWHRIYSHLAEITPNQEKKRDYIARAVEYHNQAEQMDAKLGLAIKFDKEELEKFVKRNGHSLADFEA